MFQIRKLVFGAAIAIATAACYRSDAPSCTVACATADDCPGSLTCTAAGLCAASAGMCTDQVDAPTSADGPIDADPGAIRVTVTDDRGLPAAGVRVIATSLDGTLIDDTVTVSDGTATVSTLDDAADVTIVRTTNNGSAMTTIRDASAGDALVFGHVRNEHPTVNNTVTWETEQQSVAYGVWSSCPRIDAGVAIPEGASPQTADITLDSTCVADHDILVTAIDPSGPILYQFAAGLAGNVSFVGGFWSNYVGSVVRFPQLPAGVAVSNLVFFGANVFRAGDPALGSASRPADSTPGVDGIGAYSNLQLPPIGVARDLVLTAYHAVDTSRVQQIAARIPVSGDYNLAVEPAMVPWMTSGPTVDLTGHEVLWTQVSAGGAATDGDLIVVELSYDRPSASATFTWRIIAPASSATPTGGPGRALAIPDLPGAELFEPQAGDTLGPAPWLRTYGLPGAGYAVGRLRADVAIASATDPCFPTDPCLTTDTFLVDPAITQVVSSRFDP